MRTERPKSIIWFEWLFFISCAVTIGDLFYHLYLFPGEFDGADLGPSFALIFAGGLIIDFGIQILLWFFIAYRASSVARVIYLIVWLFELFFVFRYHQHNVMSEWLFLAITQLINFGSVMMLYGTDTELWFRTKGKLEQGSADDLKDVFR